MTAMHALEIWIVGVFAFRFFFGFMGKLTGYDLGEPEEYTFALAWPFILVVFVGYGVLWLPGYIGGKAGKLLAGVTK